MSKNTQRIKLVLNQLKVIDPEDAMVVMDFIASIMPQVKRIYSSQAANLALLRNRQRELTGRLEDLEFEQSTNTPSVESIMASQQNAEAVADDDEAKVDTDEALNLLKDAEKAPKKTTKKK